MILIWLIVILLVAGIAGVVDGALEYSTAALDFAGRRLDRFRSGVGALGRRLVHVQILRPRTPGWIRWTGIGSLQLGIHFHLAVDGLSLLLLLLTFLLGIMSVLTSWREIQHGIGFFHFNLMWILAGITGVFLAMDLFLFYFSWELMLVPMYFLIAIWGHERRVYAAMKFFIFTQLSGLLMLIAILALYFIHHRRHRGLHVRI